mmetsp:Transcript_30118/g.66237  ORF Transcript_30118/g.66237 Transcript_30118/m.66237 type:complete len:260 (+) Transcript_30118:296-1075(+)
MVFATSGLMHSPGLQSLTEQSLISSFSPSLFLASMAITSCFSFLVPHTLLRRFWISVLHSALWVVDSDSSLRPWLSMAVIVPEAADFTALASLSMRAPSFFLLVMEPIWVSSSAREDLHSDLVVSSRCSVCSFSAISSATIISSRSRNRGQFGFPATVQKNLALSFAWLLVWFWSGSTPLLELRLPLGSSRSTKAICLAAPSSSAWEIQKFGGADLGSRLRISLWVSDRMWAWAWVAWRTAAWSPLEGRKVPSTTPAGT